MEKEVTQGPLLGPCSEAKGREGRTYLKLLPLSEARKMIGSQFGVVGSELVDVDRSLGRVCASVVRSKSDIPLRTTCAMDGYAVRSADTLGASLAEPSRLRIVMPADGQLLVDVGVRAGEALAVSTGDELPKGSDAVLRMEQSRLEERSVLASAEIPKWKNVSFAAEDVRAGQVLLRKGEAISPAATALMISAGVVKVRARRIPRVGVISVGRSLTSFRDASPGKTINNYANLLLGYLSELGAEAKTVGIAGRDVRETSDLIERAARDSDMVLTVGGASVGDCDLVPDAVLRCPDSRMVFHGLRAVPMRPAGLASVGGKPVVLLPGHAVSAALSFFVIGIPVLNVIGGLQPGSRRALIGATAAEELSNGRPISSFVLVTMKRRGGAYSARPLGWGSNLQYNLALANGFVHLGPRQTIPAGHAVDVELLGSSQLLRILD